MDKETSKLLSALLDPRVARFIDWQGLVGSAEFSTLARELIDQHVKHGDYRHIKSLLDCCADLKSFKGLLLWFCDSAGLDYRFGGDGLRLQRASSTRIIEGDRKYYFKKYSGTAEECGAKAPKKKTMKRSITGRGSPFLQGGAPGLGKRS